MLTCIAAGHDSDDGPGDGLEEVVRARHEREAVPAGDRTRSRARRAQVAQRDVRVQVREFGELFGGGAARRRRGSSTRLESGAAFARASSADRRTSQTARQDQRKFGFSRMVPRM